MSPSPAARGLAGLVLVFGALAFADGASSGPRAAAAAVASGHLEIAREPEGPWSNTVGAMFEFGGAKPGETVAGEVWLRLTDDGEVRSLEIAALADEESTAWMSQLRVVAMELDGATILERWPHGCRGSDGALSLEELDTCQPEPPLGLPAAAGSHLVMALEVSSNASNALQGTTGEFVLAFGLVPDPATPAPSPEATPIQPPGREPPEPEVPRPTATAASPSLPVAPPAADPKPEATETGGRPLPGATPAPTASAPGSKPSPPAASARPEIPLPPAAGTGNASRGLVADLSSWLLVTIGLALMVEAWIASGRQRDSR